MSGDTKSSNEPSIDVSVFRFTLGIPGFDDGDLPKVVGSIMGSLLLLNHFFSQDQISAAQWRSEITGALLAAMAIISPWVGSRLKEAKRGRAALKDKNRSIFALSDNLNDSTKKEVAWATYSIIRNTTTTAVILFHNGEVLSARGVLGDTSIDPQDKSKILTSLTQDLTLELPIIAQWFAESNTSQETSSTLYFPTLNGGKKLSFMPRGVKSTLIQTLGDPKSFLILISDNERAYPTKSRNWVKLLGNKLESYLNSQNEDT